MSMPGSALRLRNAAREGGRLHLPPLTARAEARGEPAVGWDGPASDSGRRGHAIAAGSREVQAKRDISSSSGMFGEEARMGGGG